MINAQIIGNRGIFRIIIIMIINIEIEWRNSAK